jgi:hypothetical protein
MAKITRALQKVFGGSLTQGLTSTIPDFGSLAAGSPAASGNPVTMQTAAWLGGWASAVVGNHSPALEDMNTAFYLLSRQIAYLMQQGVAEYDATTPYFHYGLALDSAGTGLYESQQDNNTGNALSSTSWWLPYQDQHSSRGAAKAFVSFAGSNGAIFNAYNCTVARNSTGNYTVTCAAGWGNITPVITGTVGSAAPGVFNVITTDATTVNFKTYNLSGVLTDFGTVYVAFFA